MRLIRGGSLHGHSSSSSYYSSYSAENSSSISFNSAEIDNYFYEESERGLMYLNNDSVSSAIFLACERGALPELRQFVSSCFVELAHLKNELDETPLHVASGNGFEDLVHFLLKCGCNPNIGDGQGDTPLIWASRNGHTNVFKYLIKSVEMVNITNKNKETALHIATRYTQGKAVLALLEAGADPHLMDKVILNVIFDLLN
uniref:ANK_REP_REGION domain-containing protein n=1 Tax=Meloidogyne hapla TaxID=6305 RepID=A0A1I8BJZ1_MELHA